MEIKDIIRTKREELNLTYEQLGNMIGVGKSTVRKWETGMIENMRRDNIVALSKALNISPAIIMGLENDNTEEKVNIKLSKEETTLLENYNKLNDLGKKEANKRVSELSYMPMYCNNEITATKDNVLELTNNNTEEYTLAAHDDGLDEETKKINLEKAKAMFKQMDKE
ncbi:helix-turn-helix domain-containing protein [Clostridium neonatale]|uniref:helix-turn-helix domain-containing protein n=1 Tax=Clostridium neonatale TaxID=137838 RepID=UPI00291B37DF|nr:helix-turn-helix transcriptional regulator [Clostridium neonatale]CAI3208572.1 Helix-turn-helix transcriptional regulator [Clostridium neonatale]CAI3212868.1 Helix-turn-helix transcriptional regulator [Clostridium neonatale]